MWREVTEDATAPKAWKVQKILKKIKITTKKQMNFNIKVPGSIKKSEKWEEKQMNLSMKKRVWRWERHLHCRRKTDRCFELGISICILVWGSIINDILPLPSPCPLVLLQTELERVWSSQWQRGKSQLLIQWEICCGRMRWYCQWKVGEGSLSWSSEITSIQT